MILKSQRYVRGKVKDYWEKTCLVVKLADGNSGIWIAKFLWNCCPNSNSVHGPLADYFQQTGPVLVREAPKKWAFLE